MHRKKSIIRNLSLVILGKENVNGNTHIAPIFAIKEIKLSIYTCHDQCEVLWKLDGVGPVDNRPFTDWLHHKKK